MRAGLDGEPRRVAIVDNDVITRTGIQAVLEQADGIEVVMVTDHDSVAGTGTDWAGIDVAIVDAADSRHADGDHFPGVAVVRSIRATGSADAVTVVVLTGQSMHAGLRRRMWEAGADFFYGRDESMTADELVSLVLHPSEHRSMDRSRHEVAPDLGIGPDTSVNEVIERLQGLGAEEALRAGGAKKNERHGARSRWWDALRAGAGGANGLAPTKANGDASAASGVPSVPQLRKFWLAMTKVRGQGE